MRNEIKIGLFGFGCVGQGLYDVLESSSGFKANIVKICVKDKSKKRNLPMERFTFDKNDILNNPEINLIVELIDNAEDAYEIVKTALLSGKNVVTANKKMVATHLEELYKIQQEKKVSILYEAAVCGSIPIIRNLEEYYDNELLYAVSGIVNGSSNYILSKVFSENMEYATALKQAQDLGFAETDPTLDVGGFDARYKLSIITAHSFGIFINPEDVFTFGIQNLSAYDKRFAKEKRWKIKLVPYARKVDSKTISLFVMPQFVNEDEILYNVENENNGVVVEAAFADKQFFYGKGAGGHPTGSAVLSDISANTYGYKYEYKKTQQHLDIKVSQDILIEIYVRYHEAKDLKLFDFESMSEQFYSSDFNYVIGVIKLDNLRKISRQICNSNVFIVNTGRRI